MRLPAWYSQVLEWLMEDSDFSESETDEEYDDYLYDRQVAFAFINYVRVCVCVLCKSWTHVLVCALW